MKNKLAIYVRDSTSREAHTKFQIKAGIIVAKKLKMKYKVFVETDNVKKPIRSKVLSIIYEGGFNCLYVSDMNRLSRCGQELFEIRKALETKSIPIFIGNSTNEVKISNEETLFLDIVKLISKHSKNN